MKSKKIISLMLFSVLILGFLVGCGKKVDKVEEPQTSKEDVVGKEATKKDGGTIIFPIGSDPNVLNPLYAGDRVTMTINNALYAPLYFLDSDGTDFYLAESVDPSEDFLTYTVKLKDGLKWHDGEAITADDIVFTIESLLNPEQNSHLRDAFVINGSPIQITKVDELTAEFKLPEVSVPFMNSLGGIRPIPKHIFEGEADLAQSTKNATPIGSGAFKFKDSKPGELVELVRFDDYFDGKANLESVVYRVIADPNSANIALQSGELSARYLDASDAQKFSSDENLNIITFNEGMLNNMVFNLNNEDLKNLDVRRAIAYGINKAQVIEGAYLSEDYATKADSIFVPTTMFHTDKVEKYDFNIDTAKELLEKAGVDNLKLKLAYINGTKSQESQAIVMQQNLKDIGIDLEILAMERGAFYEKLLDPANKDFDLAYNGYVMGLEPNGYRPLFMTGNMNNFMKYSNTEVDDMWAKGVVETDPTKRQEIYEKIQEQIMEDMVLYPIAYPKSIVAMNKSFGGTEEAQPAPIFMFRDLSKLYMFE